MGQFRFLCPGINSGDEVMYTALHIIEIKTINKEYPDNDKHDNKPEKKTISTSNKITGVDRLNS